MDAATLAAARAQMFPRVLPPSGFPTFVKLPTPKVYRLGGGRFRTVVNLAPLRPTGGTTYYVDRAGSAGNTGLTSASPWNIATAIAAVNAGTGGDTIVLLPSTSDYFTTSWATITKSCQVVASAPGVRITNWNSTGVTWTAASGTAGVSGTVYSTPKLSTDGVFDLANLTIWTDRNSRNHRNYTEYTNKGTAANQAAALALITADGQYAFDGTSLYVRPTGAMDLTNTTTRANLRLRQTGTVGINASGSGVVVYCRGFSLEGHSYFGATNNATLVGEDMSLKYGANNATTFEGGHSVMVRCVASGNGRDGFNYHDVSANNSEFIEVDCVSGYNGVLDVVNNNNNATTCHESCRGIRVGGSYSRTSGPTVADVGSAKTWNLGCDARDSISPGAQQRQNWRTDNTAEQWLDECSSDGANTTGGTGTGYTFYTSATGAKIHLGGYRGMLQPLAIEPNSVGVVDFYTAT